jgi:hypothetical protein
MHWKRRRSSEVPVIMTGTSSNALPPGYTAVIGADLRQPSRYFTEVAALAATLLDIHHLPEVGLLQQFNKDIDQIVQEAVKPEHLTELPSHHRKNIGSTSCSVEIQVHTFTTYYLGW